MTAVGRERPIFPGIGGKLVKREPDGLRGSRLQAQLWAAYGDTRINEIAEMRELGAGEILDVHTLPFAPDEQVLIG